MTVVRVGAGVLLALSGLIALLGSVDSDGTPSVPCGGPAVSVAFGGGDAPVGWASDCRGAGADQALGGGIFLGGGAALLLERRVREWLGSSRSRDDLDDAVRGGERIKSVRGRWISASRARWLEASHEPGPTQRGSELRGSVNDPGWRPAVKALVPLVGLRMAMKRRSASPGNGLVTIRQAFLAFPSAIAMLGFVLWLMGLKPAHNSPSAGLVTVVVGAVAVGAMAAGPLLHRPLDSTTDASLAETWRTRFFVQIALAELPALFGFTGALLAGAIAPYLLGAAVAAAMFVRVAPTARHLDRDQQELRNRSARSLVTVLATATVRPPDQGRA